MAGRFCLPRQSGRGLAPANSARFRLLAVRFTPLLNAVSPLSRRSSAVATGGFGVRVAPIREDEDSAG
ncbi:MAG: hypothetical protein CMJ58_04295 [Planctomycetaceae bacterium]|nr:hypothetical protein [Planctomycetaceae bacterium]